VNWLAHVLGLASPDSAYYLWWSGFAANISNVTLLVGIVLFYQHRKCVSCFRIGKHHVEGTAWSTCHRHLTRKWHDRLLGEYAKKWPSQHELLSSDRADTENLIEP
jgi:hypothetical protein